MPNLKHLLEELAELGVEPKKVRIPGQLYDSMVADAEVISKHPYVAMWMIMVQFLLYLPQYDSVCNSNITAPTV